MFNCLPLAAVVSDRIFCAHGGISPELKSFEQIRRIQRPTLIPDKGLLNDLLWVDPSHDGTLGMLYLCVTAVASVYFLLFFRLGSE